MTTLVVRVSLPDRPGALGSVASRIGAVGGDIISVDILRREDGQAVDEFVVELHEATPVALLMAEVHEVDGSRVEDIRPAADRSPVG